MRLVIKKYELLKMLNVAQDAIPAKSTEPCFLNFLLEVTDEGASILASDGNIHIKVFQLNKNSEGENVILDSQNGSVQLPAKITREIVSKLVGNEIALEQVDSSILTISDSKTTFNINTKEGKDYPDVEISPSVGDEVELPFKDFIKLYDATYFSVAVKTSRPLFTGINIKCSDKKISFVSSDTCRLSRMTLDINSEAKISFNCPLKVLSVISKLESVDTLRFKVGADKVSFQVGNTTIGSRIIPGEFPDVDKIIPSLYPYKMKCNAAKLIEAMDRVTIVNGDDKTSTKNIKLNFDGDRVVVSSRSSSYGTSSEVLEDCEFSGEKFTICFNSTFVSQACKSLNSEKIEILFSGEVRMFRVSCDDQNNLQLITPVRYYYN